MKAVTLLALRLCTGLYLLAWGALKFSSPEQAIEISDRFYGGQFSNPVGQLAFGTVAGVIGIFVILGFLRAFSYSAQTLFLGVGAAAVGTSVFKPLLSNFDAAAFVDAATVFVPCLTMFLISLVPFVFWREDFIALDLDQIGDLERRGASKAEPVVAAVPTLEAATEEDHGHGEPAFEPEAAPAPEVVEEAAAMEEEHPAAEEAMEDHAEAVEAEPEHAEAEAHAEAVEEAAGHHDPAHEEPVAEMAEAAEEPVAPEVEAHAEAVAEHEEAASVDEPHEDHADIAHAVEAQHEGEAHAEHDEPEPAGEAPAEDEHVDHGAIVHADKHHEAHAAH
jgi:hypothetical protein